MLGLGFVASLAIIWEIQNYGKFKISVATFSDVAALLYADDVVVLGETELTSESP